MPNTPVQATGEAMPKAKFNLSEIMRTAWAQYRVTFTRSWRKDAFNPSNFAWCLTCAWRKAREAQMTATQRRIEAIKSEIEMLSYKSLRYDIIPTKRRLEAELSALAA